MFKTFTRTWWKEANPKIWPNGLEPELGTIDYSEGETFETEEEARTFCRQWNKENPPGRYSLKMEIKEI